jgi:hypothetical protein
MNGLTENRPQHASGRTTWTDGEGRVAFTFDPRTHELLELDPRTGTVTGSWYESWNLDEVHERIRLIHAGMRDHTHHWVPRPTVGGVMTCTCGCTYRNGRIRVP